MVIKLKTHSLKFFYFLFPFSMLIHRSCCILAYICGNNNFCPKQIYIGAEESNVMPYISFQIDLCLT
ncbi:MADS3 [Zea mays]|uniref:MADS3 n=1 Tax=Zea mays TaxID=4577 RepID=A0A1D6HRI7_MAIZE|nr:MADS3 [Zea mays]